MNKNHQHWVHSAKRARVCLNRQASKGLKVLSKHDENKWNQPYFHIKSRPLCSLLTIVDRDQHNEIMFEWVIAEVNGEDSEKITKCKHLLREQK